MDVRNCPRCGRIFTYMSSPVCPVCEKEEEEAFRNVKNYIDNHSMCNLNELSEGTQVPQKRILKFIREGRLEISKGMYGEIHCDSCGKPITRGRYCDSCFIRINQGVEDLFAEDAKNKAKMHTGPRKKL